MRRLPAIALALLVAGCSLLVNTEDRTQCETNADCDANPLFRGRECRLGFCASRNGNVEPVSTDAGEACVSTEICTQKNSGRASVCKKAGTPCVPWVVDGSCSDIRGDWKDPNALVVGTILPMTIRQAQAGASPIQLPYSQRLQRAIDLATEQLRAKASGGFFVGGQRRPLAVLHCDSQGLPEIAQALFSHLVDTVGTPAVIVGWSEDLDAIAKTPRAGDATLVCSDCLAPAPPGLRPWRILPSLTEDAPLVAWRVAELEKQITAVTPGDIRVAVLIDGARPQILFGERIAEELRFNGGKTTQAIGSTGFQSFRTPDPRKETIDYDAYADAIARFAPHVVIVGMARDFPEYHLPRIEQRWPAGVPRPHYVLTQLSYDAATFDEQLTDDALRVRISGTHPYTTPELAANVATFERDYREVYSQRGNGNYSGYEALHALGLAIAANNGGPTFDAARISLGFHSLVSGEAIDLVPQDLTQGLADLSTGKSVNIRGLYTEMDWNLETREVTSDVGMFCFTRSAANAPLELHDVPAVRWSATSKQVAGSFACP